MTAAYRAPGSTVAALRRSGAGGHGNSLDTRERLTPAMALRTLMTTFLAAFATAIAACSGIAPHPGMAEHDRVLAQLEQRVATEEGWLVVTLENLHEGGGTTTWWLHPCTQGKDATRDATTTAYDGSDVVGEPGSYNVGRSEVPCVEPAATIHEGPVSLEADTELLQVGGRWVVVGGQPLASVASVGSGLTFPIADVYEPFGEPCDGVATWEAMWTGAALEVFVYDCLDTMEALPADVRDLLTAGNVATTGASAAVADFASPLAAALDASSWERTDGRGVVLWTGPCHEFSRFSLQSQVSLADGFLQMHAQRCSE